MRIDGSRKQHPPIETHTQKHTRKNNTPQSSDKHLKSVGFLFHSCFPNPFLSESPLCNKNSIWQPYSAAYCAGIIYEWQKNCVRRTEENVLLKCPLVGSATLYPLSMFVIISRLRRVSAASSSASQTAETSWQQRCCCYSNKENSASANTVWLWVFTKPRKYFTAFLSEQFFNYAWMSCLFNVLGRSWVWPETFAMFFGNVSLL